MFNMISTWSGWSNWYEWNMSFKGEDESWRKLLIQDINVILQKVLC